MALALFVVQAVPVGSTEPETVEHQTPVRPDAVLASRVDLILALEAPRLTVDQRLAIRDEVVAASLQHDLDPLFLLALMRAESRFDPHAVSPQGAVGLMQLLPATAEWIARRTGQPSRSLFDLRENIRLGATYFAYLLHRFGDATLSIEAYNRGPRAVDGALDDARGGRFAGQVLDDYRRYRTITACHTRACPGNTEWALRLDAGEIAGACHDAAEVCGVM